MALVCGSLACFMSRAYQAADSRPGRFGRGIVCALGTILLFASSNFPTGTACACAHIFL